MNIIEKLEKEEIARLGKTIPDFAPGDTVIVNVNVVEGERKRVQAYEGVVIAKRNRGLNSSFTVRKISSGEGVERTFQTYSPLLASIEVKRKGDVRRAKLYYLRARSGKSARIREKLDGTRKRQGRVAAREPPAGHTAPFGPKLPESRRPEAVAHGHVCLGYGALLAFGRLDDGAHFSRRFRRHNVRHGTCHPPRSPPGHRSKRPLA